MAFWVASLTNTHLYLLYAQLTKRLNKKGQLKLRLKDQYQGVVITPIYKTLNGYIFPTNSFIWKKYSLKKREKQHSPRWKPNLFKLNPGEETWFQKNWCCLLTHETHSTPTDKKTVNFLKNCTDNKTWT